MTTTEAIIILKKGNEWRRGSEIPMPDPKQFGEAIDLLMKKVIEMKRDLRICNRQNHSLRVQLSDIKREILK